VGAWKEAVVEPARVLSMTDLMQRVCAYYECELTDPLHNQTVKSH